MLNNISIHHHQNNFYQYINLNKMFKAFSFFSLFFSAIIQRIIYLNFIYKVFRCVFHSCIKNIFCKSIKFRSRNRPYGIGYFVFVLYGFCIDRSLGSQISSIKYFVFNICGFFIESTTSS